MYASDIYTLLARYLVWLEEEEEEEREDDDDDKGEHMDEALETLLLFAHEKHLHEWSIFLQ
jgi:hypothetical protein